MCTANLASYRIVGLVIFSLFLFGCGGGGGGGNAPAPPPPLGTDASLASLSVSGVTLDPAFSPTVTSYTGTVPDGTDSVDISATTSDGNANFTINGSNNATVTIAVGDNTISLVVTAENGTTTRTYTIVVTRRSFAQVAYIKASNTEASDWFRLTALSHDGNTLAVGADQEDSGAIGVNGDQADNNSRSAGAVYVFTRDGGGVWTQQAYVKASNTEPGPTPSGEGADFFGRSIALSDDGNTLAVGAVGESSAATGVNGDHLDNSIRQAGAVYVFTRDTGGVWTQQAYVKASTISATPGSGLGDAFGHSLALAGDGNTLAIGSRNEASGATGIDGDQLDESAPRAGAVFVFARDGGGVWTQQAYVKASNTESDDRFSRSIALSDDGNTMAVGATREASAATGVNGDQTDNSAFRAGAVYVFTRDTGGVWTQQAYVKASNTGQADAFDIVSLSGDGNTLAVGANGEASAATGIDGDQLDNSAFGAGAVYVFTRDGGGVWTQQAYVKASNTEPGPTPSGEGADFFGRSIALSDDGNTLAVSADQEDSAATGINGDQTDNSATDAGAVYVFTRDGGGVWTQQAYVKASNTEAGDLFGNEPFFGGTTSISGDGNTLAVGAVSEDSAATGINGDQTDNSADSAGAVYVFTR